MEHLSKHAGIAFIALYAISLTADPEQDADAALVSIEQEAALASDDEDDAAALERELSALEATYLIESDEGNVMAFTNNADLLTSVLGLQ